MRAAALPCPSSRKTLRLRGPTMTRDATEGCRRGTSTTVVHPCSRPCTGQSRLARPCRCCPKVFLAWLCCSAICHPGGAGSDMAERALAGRRLSPKTSTADQGTSWSFRPGGSMPRTSMFGKGGHIDSRFQGIEFSWDRILFDPILLESSQATLPLREAAPILRRGVHAIGIRPRGCGSSPCR